MNAITPQILLTILVLTGILTVGLIAAMSLGLSIYGLIKIKAIEKSTHTVQLMPVEDAKWGLTDKDVGTINKINKNDIDLNFENLSI